MCLMDGATRTHGACALLYGTLALGARTMHGFGARGQGLRSRSVIMYIARCQDLWVSERQKTHCGSQVLARKCRWVFLTSLAGARVGAWTGTGAGARAGTWNMGQGMVNAEVDLMSGGQCVVVSGQACVGMEHGTYARTLALVLAASAPRT